VTKFYKSGVRDKVPEGSTLLLCRYPNFFTTECSIQGGPKNCTLLPSGTLSQTLDLKNFATASPLSSLLTTPTTVDASWLLTARKSTVMTQLHCFGSSWLLLLFKLFTQQLTRFGLTARRAVRLFFYRLCVTAGWYFTVLLFAR